MATRIAMRHKTTGMLKNGYYGFSWTTFFFGFFPALFRGDFITFAVWFLTSFILAVVTEGYASSAGGAISLIWAFIYNKYYTCKLIESGYEFAGIDDENSLAAAALSIAPVPASA